MTKDEMIDKWDELNFTQDRLNPIGVGKEMADGGFCDRWYFEEGSANTYKGDVISADILVPTVNGKKATLVITNNWLNIHRVSGRGLVLFSTVPGHGVKEETWVPILCVRKIPMEADELNRILSFRQKEGGIINVVMEKANQLYKEYMEVEGNV